MSRAPVREDVTQQWQGDERTKMSKAHTSKARTWPRYTRRGNIDHSNFTPCCSIFFVNVKGCRGKEGRVCELTWIETRENGNLSLATHLRHNRSNHARAHAEDRILICVKSLEDVISLL